jgi:hypothetical protein
MKALTTIVLASALGLAASAAQSTVITLSGITASWFDPTPAANISANLGAGTATPQIRWGGTAGDPSTGSGYNFGAAAGAAALVPPSPSANFVLGTFQHVNFPILASITGVRLGLTSDVFVDGILAGTLSFVFDFIHDETPNADDPCRFGGANGQGVNINGCADRVTVAFSDASESFLVGGDLYTINVVGFELGSGVFSTEFLTAESALNTASLIANVTLRSSLVDEPGTLALFGLGIAALVGVRRLRWRSSAVAR